MITSNYVSGCAALLSRCCSAAEEELLSKHWCIKSAVSGKVSGLEKEDLEEVPEGRVILAPLLSKEECKKTQECCLRRSM